MKFVADCMLGRLAKWLKIFGFDVLFFPRAEDRDLVEIARRDGRILLTRDTGLIEKTAKRPNRLFVRSDDWEDQIVQVLDELDLWNDVRPNTRCIECNIPLKALTKERARNLVTPYVSEHASSFAICPACNRVFWQGTHYGDMEKKVAKLVGRHQRI